MKAIRYVLLEVVEEKPMLSIEMGNCLSQYVPTLTSGVKWEKIEGCERFPGLNFFRIPADQYYKSEKDCESRQEEHFRLASPFDVSEVNLRMKKEGWRK